MQEPFPPGASKAKEFRSDALLHEGHQSLWRWTAVLIHALRQALCPSPGILALIEASTRGELSRSLEDAKRKHKTQAVTLRELLKGWILG